MRGWWGDWGCLARFWLVGFGLGLAPAAIDEDVGEIEGGDGEEAEGSDANAEERDGDRGCAEEDGADDDSPGHAEGDVGFDGVVEESWVSEGVDPEEEEAGADEDLDDGEEEDDGEFVAINGFEFCYER